MGRDYSKSGSSLGRVLAPLPLCGRWKSAYRFGVLRAAILQASSLRINEALLLSSLDGYMPFTDSDIHDRLLRLKTSRSLIAPKGNDNRDLADKLALLTQVAVPYQTLAVSIVDHLVPQRALDRRTVKEIIKYRRENKDLFSKFYERVRSLASELQSVSPSADYAVQLQKLLSNKVTPEITKGQEALRAAYEESFGKLGLKAAAAIAPSLTAGVFGGLDPLQILGISAAAVTTMLGTKGVDDIVKIWTAKREAGRAPFAYVLNLQRED